MNTQAINDNHVTTKAYVEKFHNDNKKNRRGLGLKFFNESSNFVKIYQDIDVNDKKLTNKDSITVNREPTSNNELANKSMLMTH